MTYKVEFEIEGEIEVEAESKEKAERLVRHMDRHTLFEEGTELNCNIYAYVNDEEEKQ